jgi:hypothetical protein
MTMAIQSADPKDFAAYLRRYFAATPPTHPLDYIAEVIATRDDEIRAEERDNAARRVEMAMGGPDPLADAIRACAQPAEPPGINDDPMAAEREAYLRAYKEANGWRMRPDGSYFKPGS